MVYTHTVQLHFPLTMKYNATHASQPRPAPLSVSGRVESACDTKMDGCPCLENTTPWIE